MNTPIVDFVERYRSSGTARFHMPGHKGQALLGWEPWDITEIRGADQLYQPEGILAQSEANAGSLFGFGRTLYVTEGSSQCLKAMLFLAKLAAGEEGNTSRTVLAGRNVHQAFVSACALLDLNAIWLFPEEEESSICRCRVTPQGIAQALDRLPEKPFAVYLTAPDYLGYSPDIDAIGEICREKQVLLLVDNAHGAYLHFLQPSRHPVDLGAFLSCDSAHKTLPVLTGGAYLQLSRLVSPGVSAQAKKALALFGSTSPSYLILQSLDRCNRYLWEGYTEKLAETVGQLNELKKRLGETGWHVEDSDPLRIVIDTASKGYTGKEAADYLRLNGLEPEFADVQAVVLMCTPENTGEELNRLEQVLCDLPTAKKRVPSLPRPLHPLHRSLSIREATLALHETIPTAEAEGRICAALTLSCPPAIPLAVSGEVLDKETLALFRAYDIAQVEVVKE